MTPSLPGIVARAVPPTTSSAATPAARTRARLFHRCNHFMSFPPWGGSRGRGSEEEVGTEHRHLAQVADRQTGALGGEPDRLGIRSVVDAEAPLLVGRDVGVQPRHAERGVQLDDPPASLRSGLVGQERESACERPLDEIPGHCHLLRGLPFLQTNLRRARARVFGRIPYLPGTPMPNLRAAAAASPRDAAPSFWRIAETWWPAVFSEMKRRLAISALLRPLSSRASTSTWRRVSCAGAASVEARGRAGTRPRPARRIAALTRSAARSAPSLLRIESASRMAGSSPSASASASPYGAPIRRQASTATPAAASRAVAGAPHTTASCAPRASGCPPRPPRRCPWQRRPAGSRAATASSYRRSPPSEVPRLPSARPTAKSPPFSRPSRAL